MPRSTALFVLVAALLAWTGAQADLLGDEAEGKAVFGKCKGCHQVGVGAENKIGPHLNGVFGRAAAGLAEFRYSPSLQRAGAGGLEWHADTLDAFLENPRSYASGTRMSFRGLKDAADRANLIAYLRGFSDDPGDIPEADPTAKSAVPDLDPAILNIKGDPEFGAYLSGECTSCHRADGGDDGIPSIVLWPEDDFVLAMHAYRNKQRQHPVMQMIAGRLSDEEIAALAAYFTGLSD